MTIKRAKNFDELFEIVRKEDVLVGSKGKNIIQNI